MQDGGMQERRWNDDGCVIDILFNIIMIMRTKYVTPKR